MELRLGGVGESRRRGMGHVGPVEVYGIPLV